PGARLLARAGNHEGNAYRAPPLRQARASRWAEPRRGGDRAAPARRHVARPSDRVMPRHSCSCNDFSRTELMRRAAAEAGRGLPSIEPGMPVPAGTGMSRRSFVTRSAGLALAVYGGSWLGSRAFEDGIAQAASLPSSPVLVS